MINDHNFPIKVYYRDPTSRSLIHPGFSLWSHHRSAKAAERAYRELVADLTKNGGGKDVELIDTRTGERKRFGGEKWRRRNHWLATFVMQGAPCVE